MNEEKISLSAIILSPNISVTYTYIGGGSTVNFNAVAMV